MSGTHFAAGDAVAMGHRDPSADNMEYCAAT
jgi:hypothetical protein